MAQPVSFTYPANWGSSWAYPALRPGTTPMAYPGQAAWMPAAASYPSANGLNMAVAASTPLSRIRVQDPEISAALQVLDRTANLQQDERYLESLGVNVIFHNGRDALDLMARLGVSVEFGDTGDPKAHAVWQKDQNKMIVNHRYRGDMSPAVLYAIAAAIYHEAGHAARLGDAESSIQEEIDCLALNTMAYRAHTASDPGYAWSTSQGPLKALFEDGVALYPRLFFDPDPYKQALVNRIIEKYGMLPPETADHPIPAVASGKALTERVLYEIHRRNAIAYATPQILPAAPAQASGQAPNSQANSAH